MLYDEFFINRLEDMFLFADRNVSLRYTSFLDCSEVAKAENYIKSIAKLYPQVEYCFWGGFEGAERRILCVYNTYLELDMQDFPLSVVEFDYNSNFSKLTHRDFLGAMMSLQIKRDAIGDIVVGAGKTQVVVSNNVSSLILQEVTCIGRLGVHTSLVDKVSLEVKQSFKSISGTVPSLRLDCVLALALNVSRSKAVQIVKSKVVAVNYIEQTSPDYTTKLNDTLTIKGYGKYILSEVSEPTKKNRLHILINKYL
jgi:RNA-binding protein YlmH